ncbi:SLBB domain-containing protein [Dyadobacter diqingensis]|uniref:SLBB domain-containing protein n=1 Tax=Dyadobacter diqingensis TaxID=2938121 RepID=UPI0020C1B67F|nr:SLBB domain-containing protein [Dyadobacter diqingensis]
MHYLRSLFLQKHVLSFVFALFLLNIQLSFAQTPQISKEALKNASPATVPLNQISTQQATDFYNRARSAGMTDSDIQKAALQRGFSNEQINEMLKKVKDGNKDEDTKDSDRDKGDDAREQEDKTELDQDGKSAGDSAKVGESQSGRRNRIFGASFFRNKSNTFEPNLRLATPTNYILGPEDELIVDIYGNSVDNFKLKVSPEGTVKMLNLAPVYINGLSIEQAEAKILNRLRQAYSGLNRPGSGTYLSLTLGSVRSIRVMITGEVSRPGTYTVSSLATAFNALYLSGGPTSNGSYRNIEIIRNNTVIRKIDLYKFLIDADLKDNIALRDQDIILIRPYKKRVQLLGEVKREGIFEATDNESLQDLIKYAGGYTPEAVSSIINYQRNTGANYIIGTIKSDEIASFKPENGDIVTVSKISDAISNQVEIRGAITLPGIYALEDRCNTVLELIQMAQGIAPRTFLNRATLERSGGGALQTGIIAIDLEKLVNKQIEDIELLPGDILTIKSVDDLKESNFLTIAGSVIKPGTFPYFKNITVSDLIFQAGGFREEGISYRIEVSRRIKDDTTGIPASQNVQIFTLNVEDNLKLNEHDEKFKLMPYDIIMIRKSPRYEVQKIVTVLGEVVYPGSYTILNNFERISDLIPKVGGLKPEANLSGARFYRNGEQIAIDLRAVEKTPSLSSNLLLLNSDSLRIPRKSEIVRINGGVFNPSVMNFDPKFSYKDYISQAGGYMERAWKTRVYVSYPNGRTHRTNRFLFFKSYPKIQPGSVINVPIKEEKMDRQTTPSERIAIFSIIASVLSSTAILIINSNK